MELSGNLGALRKGLGRELDRANREVLGLGREVEERLEVMADALEDRGALTAGEAAGGARLKLRRAEIEESCLLLQARQAPVARDLRLVLALRAVADHAVRAGALCEHVLEALRETEGEGLGGNVPEMARRACWLFGMGLAAFESRNVELGRSLRAEDDRVDLLYRRVMSLLAGSGDDAPSGQAVRAALAAHHLERIADHGVGIGERAVFLGTARRRQGL